MSNISFQKSADWKSKMIPLLGAAGNAAFWDWQSSPENQTLFGGEWDNRRRGMAALNALIGAGGASLMRTGFADPNRMQGMKAIGEGSALLALSPVKDLVLNSLTLPRSVEKGIDGMEGLQKTITDSQQSQDKNTKSIKYMLGALGLGALGLGAVGVGKYLTRKDPEQDMGRISVALPGAGKRDGSKTVIEVPMNAVEMSPALMAGLGRDVRKTLRKGVKERAFKRDPESGELIPFSQFKAKYPELADEGEVLSVDDVPSVLEKAASSLMEEASRLIQKELHNRQIEARDKEIMEEELERRKVEGKEKFNNKLTKEACLSLLAI